MCAPRDLGYSKWNFQWLIHESPSFSVNATLEKDYLLITSQWNLNDNGNDKYIRLKIFWDCLQLSKYSKKLILNYISVSVREWLWKTVLISVAIFLGLLLAIFFLNYLFIFLTVNLQCTFDMWYDKTQVTSYELQVENFKARVEIQKCKFKSTSYEFKFTSYKFKSSNYEFKFTKY